jgi:hypothetical protein
VDPQLVVAAGRLGLSPSTFRALTKRVGIGVRQRGRQAGVNVAGLNSYLDRALIRSARQPDAISSTRRHGPGYRSSTSVTYSQSTMLCLLMMTGASWALESPRP